MSTFAQRQRGLSHADVLYGYQAKLNLFGDEKRGTYCGALSSILVISAILFCLALELKLCFLTYFDTLPAGSGLRYTTLSQLSTYDEELLKTGYELGRANPSFQVAVGILQVIEFDYSPLGDEVRGLIDPRIGTLKAELVEVVTDEFYVREQTFQHPLTFKECPFPKSRRLRGQVCIDFDRQDSPHKLYGAYDGQGQDFSYIKLSVSQCDPDEVKALMQDKNAECFNDN